MDPRNFSTKTKRLAWKRCGGHCEKCTAELAPGNIRYDHRNPWEISHDSSLENCWVLCRSSCDHKKTYEQDIPTIAKVHRIEARNFGFKNSGKSLPAGRDSGLKKKLNGEVVRRPERGETHRALMAKRQIAECDHIPMKAALDDSIGCIRCGQWLKGQ